MRKSQLYGHIFIYILTVVITSFILVYGYNAVKNFREKTDEASCLKFRNDLQGAIYTIMSDYGTVKRKDFDLCSNYNMICFVESFESFDKNNPQSNTNPIDPIIKDNMLSNTGKNVFLVAGLAKDRFYAGNITVGKDVLCIPASGGRISLRLEGLGNRVALDKW